MEETFTKTRSEKKQNRVFYLFKLACFSPIFALQNLTYDRLKKLMIAIWCGDSRKYMEDIFNNYPQLFVKHKESRKAKYLENAKTDAVGPLVISQSDHVFVSIVIYAYNNWHLTQKCIWSIVNTTQNINYEIILADDNSRDETRLAKERINGLKIHNNSVDLGYLETCNIAAQKTGGQHIVFLHNDVQVKEGWLENLLKVLDQDPLVGIAGSKVLFPNGKLQEAGGIIWKDGVLATYGRTEDAAMPEHNYMKEVDYVSGVSFIIRKKIWDEIGGFDTKYSPAYYEDADISFETRRRGYKVIYQPKSVAIHSEEQIYGSESKYDLLNFVEINRKKFIQKWSAQLENQNLKCEKSIFRARDRSHAKKTLLIIDHYVPHFDQDAGSKSTFQYLKLFNKMGFNIKFIGDNFFKHEPYTSYLQDLGIEVLYGNYYQNNWKNWIKDNAEHIDYIYLHRPHISIKYIDFCRKYTQAKILYQCHDLHFIRTEEQYKVTGNRKHLKESRSWKDMEEKIFQNVDAVLTFSKKELSLLQARYPEMTVCQIPLYIYDTIPDIEYDPANRNDLFFVGGFRHSPNVDGILWFVKNVFPQIKEKIQDLNFLIAGSNPPDEIQKLQSDSIRILGYVSEEKLEKLYSTTKLAVVPLLYGAGIKGKTIEAMYYGVPVLTTKYGIEGVHGLENLITPSNTPQDMIDQAVKLLSNDHKLPEISQDYQRFIQNNFSEQIAMDAFNTILSILTATEG